MIELKRGNGPFDFRPLTWRPVKSPYGGYTAIVVCSNGHEGLIPDHAIAEDGLVSPSVVCKVPECMFHETVMLVGWEEVL